MVVSIYYFNNLGNDFIFCVVFIKVINRFEVIDIDYGDYC